MSTSISVILETLDEGAKLINVNGLCGSAGSFLLSKIAANKPRRPILFITSTQERAKNIFDDLNVFCGSEAVSRLALFSAPDVLPYTQLSPEPRLWAERLEILFELAHGAPNIIVTPISACLRLLPPKIFTANVFRTIRKDDEINRDELTMWLAEMGYSDVGIVEDVGEFAVRGCIIDAWTPKEKNPVRMELESDKIISMRCFDPATQRSSEDMVEVTFIPVRDVPFSRESARIASQAIVKLAEEADIPAGERQRVIEYLNEGTAFAGLETFMPLFHGSTASLADYLPDGALVISDDPAAVSQSAERHLLSIQDLARHTTSIERLVPPERLYLSYNKWETALQRFRRLSFNALTFPPEVSPDTRSLNVETFSNADLKPAMEKHLRQEDPLAPVINILKERSRSGEDIIFTTHTKLQAERLLSLFKPHGVSLAEFDSPFDSLERMSRGVMRIKLAKLSAGFRWPEARLTVITDEELFGAKVIRKPPKRSPVEHFVSFAELSQGDYLVHEIHGIGRYGGLKNMSIDGKNNDFILLEYLGGDKLYLPVYRLNLLQRYVGPGDMPPFLDKLGGTRWSKAQEKAKREILSIAKDLLNIYAAREVHPGFPFPPKDQTYEEFSAAFPYDETPDQTQAIDDVIRDMELERPMDRLICGDVGYGKTEVAVRAAFKAAMAGKQVAVLVPTTLLAYQHFENFRSRFEATPVKIEMLSRFRTPAEQKAIIEEIRRGTLDIVIGTHRLLQKDVSFKDLGLLIIDEEQHFGVTHKEKIRKLRATVDCLTLTATPIPRTLHLSLTGIRDISVIDTPPVDRQAISTQIAPFDDGVIRHAILFELARGGQVFFVHNRVETIRSMEEHLKKLVPEASIGVAHGQMNERDLEQVMTKFLIREHNVLLTTSIIESGLDIPSANTIIVDRADTFGLAQLYQIRGRIGRSNVRGYAYLLIPSDGDISPSAKKRLTVLQRFTELGSGFQIAMHDLEIRGAGSILGRAQSGHVAAIGYEMYTKLLAREIKRLQGKEVEEEIDPELSLSVSAFLPDSFIEDAGTRLELYRRLASRETLDEVSEMASEIEDRFGTMPDEAKNLLGVMEIKVLAKQLKIRQLTFDGRMFACKLDKSNPIDLALLTKLIEGGGRQYRLRPPDRILYITTPLEEAKDILSHAKNFLSVLLSCVTPSQQS
jgi:transcription-repair coupling factor (superfamily II helicase)